MTTNTDAYDWGDALPAQQEKKIMPEGLATYEVLGYDRKRREVGSLGMCNVAALKLVVTSEVDPEIRETITDEIPLHSRMVWKAYQFFASIGQYRHGDVENGATFTPDWSKIKGAIGVCAIKHRTWKTRTGDERMEADIGAYYDANGRTRASDDGNELAAGLHERIAGQAADAAAAFSDDIPF